MTEPTKEEILAQAIRTAFNEAQGQEEDAIKLAMISAGATFKNVTRLFNEFCVDAGLVTSKEDKEKVLAEVLTGADLSLEEVFDAKVAELQASLQGVNEKSAAALIRAYAKKNELEVFKKAKATGEGAGKAGFAGKFYDFLVANPTATKEQAVAFIQGTDGNEETSENVKKHQSHYLGIHNLVSRIAAA